MAKVVDKVVDEVVDEVVHDPGAGPDQDDRDDQADRRRIDRDAGDRTHKEGGDLTKLAEPPLHEPEMDQPPADGRLASASKTPSASGVIITEGAPKDTARAVAKGTAEAVTDDAHAAPVAAVARRSPAHRSRVTLIGLIVAVLALAAPLLISSASSGPEAATRPTAVPPTPTVTPLPSPTSAVGAGLSAYVDTATGYEMGYPASWTATQQNPGVAFDDANNDYEVHVILPNNSALPDQSDPTTMAASWVDYALDSEQQRWGANNFQRLGGPTPPVTIGGQAWQTGTALIGTQYDARIRLQVYATIHNGTAYVLVLLAPDPLFARGQQAYFGPMLASFVFLPASS
ncbi:MAG TPA: PsbP-related protein [Ktedonobacterales bacterium]